MSISLTNMKVECYYLDLIIHEVVNCITCMNYVHMTIDKNNKIIVYHFIDRDI
jgi:hypothetical protein